MNFLRYFESKTIDLEVDTQFNNQVTYNISLPPTEMTFKIWELIFGLGEKLTTQFEPTLRNKLFDYSPLIDKIHGDTDFKVLITRIRTEFGPEVLGDTSKEIGVAISLLVMNKYFDTPNSNISRVNTTRLRVDYSGVTNQNHTIALEAKGSSSLSTLTKRIAHGKDQLATSSANIKVVVGTLINEDVCSIVKIIDPPGDYLTIDKLKFYSAKAINLSGLFNFLGHPELSKYFDLMSKRILKEGYEGIAAEKEYLYSKINYQYLDFKYRGHKYKGTVIKFDESYIFTGINANAIGFYDFIDELSWKENKSFSDEKAILYLGKILVKELVGQEVIRHKQYSQNYYQQIYIEDFELSSSKIGRKIFADMLRNVGYKVIILNNGLMKIDGEVKIFIYYRKLFYKTGKFFDKEFKYVTDRRSKIEENEPFRFYLVTPSILEAHVEKGIDIIDNQKMRLLIDVLKLNSKKSDNPFSQ